MAGLPSTGEASTYADYLNNHHTANGERYTHAGYTAALLPQARWYDVPMGTLLKLGYGGRTVVVRVNDRGAGDGTMNRVLDLSHAAYAYLSNVPLGSVTDRTASVLQLTSIALAPVGAQVGPGSP